MSQSLKQLWNWKHSASLIILGKNSSAPKVGNINVNYKVLVLERPSKSSYPGAVVFPGGVTEHVDHADDWLQLYQKFGIDSTKLDSISKKCTKRSFIFQPDAQQTHISKDISLRLTAIRETFEELGILICRRKEQLTDAGLTSSLVHDFDVKFWQKEVFNDATKFIKLCEQLDVVPDIWSLYEWSVWLTPTWKRTKRFETVFYLVGVDEQPDINVENDEVQNSWWHSPDELLQLNRSGTIWLPPPQLYELARLSHESDIDRLLSFAKTRGENSPTTLIFPIHFHTSDGLIHCYPGDDFYPKNPDYNKTTHDLEQYATKTCAECRAMAKNLHRAELKSINDVDIWQNIGNFDDHLCPDTTKNTTTEVTSKL